MRHSFIDEVDIEVLAGAGGAGCVAFRREKCMAFGGPNGGNGGRGGDVTLLADPQLYTLLDYRFAPRQRAGDGGAGGGSQCTGRDGASRLLRVPVGTVISRRDPADPSAPPIQLADLDQPGQRFLVVRGGRGGKGNEHFKRATRQAPDYAQPGEPGEQCQLRLTLKLLANVGLIGLPNVGKSSLLGRMSACRPKVADYPFTTLVPNLGVVRGLYDQDFVVADVPGLVPGAHRGQGLGARFLRHVERVQILVHVLTADAYGQDSLAQLVARYAAIEAELRLHAATLQALPRLVVLNRMDLSEVARWEEPLRADFAARGVPLYLTSAATGAGIDALVGALAQIVSSTPAAPAVLQAEARRAAI